MSVNRAIAGSKILGAAVSLIWGLANGAIGAEISSAAATTVGATVAAPDPAAARLSALGLEERRGLEKFRQENYPKLLNAIRGAAGYDIDIDVRWDTIVLEGLGEHFTEDGFWTNVYFVPLIEAFKQVGKDAMGKQALKKGLKRIQISFDEATAPASDYAKGLSFDNGVLSINWRPFTNADALTDRSDALIKAIEPKI